MLIYIAGPYRPGHGRTVDENIASARRAGALVAARTGHMPVIPQMNTAHFEDDPETAHLPDAFWLDGTLELMLACDAVYMAPHWQQSSGACNERERALARGMPVYYSIDEIPIREGYREQPAV